MSLVNLSRAYNQMKYDLRKAQDELNELHGYLWTFSQTKDPEVKAMAKSFLLAVVRERQAMLDAIRSRQ